MSDDHSRYPSIEKIWVWLVTLLVIGLLVGYLPLGQAGTVVAIFSVATIKAFLVIRHYMHMRQETLIISAIAGIPVLLLLGFALSLVPDIVFNR